MWLEAPGETPEAQHQALALVRKFLAGPKP